MTDVSLKLGALADPLQAQLDAQGLTLRPGQCLSVFQRDADAITRCSVRGLIADSAVFIARKRLMKNIAAQVISVQTGARDMRDFMLRDDLPAGESGFIEAPVWQIKATGGAA